MNKFTKYHSKNLEARIKRGDPKDQKLINLELLSYISELHDVFEDQQQIMKNILDHDQKVIGNMITLESLANRMIILNGLKEGIINDNESTQGYEQDDTLGEASGPDEL